MKKTEFNLAPGVWEAYIKDCTSHELLTPVIKTWFLDMHYRVKVEIPDEFKDNENAVVYVRRVKR